MSRGLKAAHNCRTGLGHAQVVSIRILGFLAVALDQIQSSESSRTKKNTWQLRERGFTHSGSVSYSCCWLRNFLAKGGIM